MLFFILMGLSLFGSLAWVCEQGAWFPPGHAALAEAGVSGRGAYLVSVPNPPGGFAESKFASIPHSFWYVIVTITTAGYGDLSPITVLGKVVGAMTIIGGVIVLAMPVGVI